MTAVRRGVIYREHGVYNLDSTSIEDYSREHLVEYVCSAIGRVWHTRGETATATARYLGFRRTGTRIRVAIRSAVNSGFRKGKLERDGANRIRKR